MASDEKAPYGYTNGTSFVWNTEGQVIAAATVLPILGIVTVALRFYSRHKQKSGLGADDWLIIPALIIVVGMGVTLLYGVAKGVVAHTTKPNPDPSPDAQLYQITPEQRLMEIVEFIIFAIMTPAYGCIKLSVVFFYRRIFVKNTPASRFNIVTKATIVVVIIWTITFFFLTIFRAGRHVEWNWGALYLAKRGIVGSVLNDGLFISDFVTDLWVVLLPVPLIMRLHMSWARKLNVIAILLLGCMSFSAAIVRMVFNIQIAKAGLAKKTDVNQGLTTLMYWSMVEAGLSLIAVNLPTIYSTFSTYGSSMHSAFSSLRSKLSLHSSGHSTTERFPVQEKPDRVSTDGHYSESNASSGSRNDGGFASHNESYIYAGQEMTGEGETGAKKGTINVRSDLESQTERFYGRI